MDQLRSLHSEKLRIQQRSVVGTIACLPVWGCCLSYLRETPTLYLCSCASDLFITFHPLYTVIYHYHLSHYHKATQWFTLFALALIYSIEEKWWWVMVLTRALCVWLYGTLFHYCEIFEKKLRHKNYSSIFLFRSYFMCFFKLLIFCR